jgi:hypothetical protein
MKPIKTVDTEIVYRGPTAGIGDLWCHRVEPGQIRSFWKPSEDELRVLNEGGCVELDLYNEPIPPMSVNVGTATAVEDHPFKLRDPRSEI